MAAEPMLREGRHFADMDPFLCWSASEFSVGGLALEAAEEEIVPALGNPDGVIIGGGVDDGGQYAVFIYQYRGLNIEVVRGWVDMVSISSPDYPTPSGLTVGMSREEVKEILGRELEVEWQRQGWYEFPPCPSQQGISPLSYLGYSYDADDRIRAIRFYTERP